MERIGFIGTGVMGGAIVHHLLTAGYKVRIYNRTKSRAEPLIAAGAEWASTPGDAACGRDVVFTMLGFPRDVEDVYFSKQHGILARAVKGATLVDLTTSTPALAVRIDASARELGLHTLDAPVSGGDVGARNGTLTIMCGGDEEVFESMKPLFAIFGKNMILHGPAGSGQHTKMCNQIAIASTMLGVCEALAYAERSGLNPEMVLESIAPGAAGSWSLSNYGPRIIKGDFQPGFYIKHFVKDMRIALDSAAEMGLETPGLALAERLYTRLLDAGFGDLGTHALFRLIMHQTG